MAVTSIWRVNGWLGKVVVYVENPDKTTNPEFYENGDMTERECQGLDDVISYAVNSRKTEQHKEDSDVLERFVSGINCHPATARAEMMAVKKRFGKEDGTIAYHGYQSFAPGEATPEMAHKIGVELAQRLWGDRYQVVVATHLDKANHLHSHFVLNTVSFVDGIKYHRTAKDYHEMQTVSDTLCREYGLSVIENPQPGKGKHYGEWRAEQEQRPTWRGIVRSDVDEVIRQSMTERQFFENLHRKGYEVKVGKDKYKGALPVPVHFLMDEFANVSLPDDFDKLLATMRSRNVFVSIIIQNIAQLKNLFEKQWESILGNCDEFLYLGGNETGTHKMIAESYLGKQTIDLNTYGKSSGRSGNYSTNWQITGRELLDAAEVRMLDNRYALLFIRGEMPIMDEKYDLLNHPNVKFTPEKGGAPYVHGGTELSVGSLSLSTVSGAETRFINLSEMEFELLSDEEIEAELLFGGNNNEIL